MFEGLVREDFSCEKTLEQRLGRNEAVPRSNNAGQSLLSRENSSLLWSRNSEETSVARVE